jgi:hypothetical protein
LDENVADCIWLKSEICRDILFSDRELWTERAEYRGLGEAEEGGVKVGLSRRANDSYTGVSLTSVEGIECKHALFVMIFDILLYALERKCFAWEAIRI